MRLLDAAGQPLTADPALVRLLGEVCASSGPLVAVPTEIVASERPLVLKIDDRDRPHSDVSLPDHLRTSPCPGSFGRRTTEAVRAMLITLAPGSWSSLTAFTFIGEDQEVLGQTAGRPGLRPHPSSRGATASARR